MERGGKRGRQQKEGAGGGNMRQKEEIAKGGTLKGQQEKVVRGGRKEKSRQGKVVERGGSRGASWEQGQEEEVGEEGKSNGSQRRVHFAAPHQAILAAGEAWQGSATKARERGGRVEGAAEAGSSWSRQQQEEEE